MQRTSSPATALMNLVLPEPTSTARTVRAMAKSPPIVERVAWMARCATGSSNAGGQWGCFGTSATQHPGPELLAWVHLHEAPLDKIVHLPTSGDHWASTGHPIRSHELRSRPAASWLVEQLKG